MKEIWKDIKGYEGLYQISNLGRVKSLSRKMGHGRFKYISKEKILLDGYCRRGYRCIKLKNKSNINTFRIHHLVWDYFGNKLRNGRILQIDHVDGDKSNNKIQNLQLLTNRQNCSKSKDKSETYSKYIGVSWYKHTNKWIAKIYYNRKQVHLGTFNTEYKAHLAYQQKLNEINNDGCINHYPI